MTNKRIDKLKKNNLQIVFISLVIIIAALSRMIPHPLNFAPMCAIALFGAAHFSNRWLGFIIPISATFLSDLFINNYIYQSESFIISFNFWSYGSYLLIIIFSLSIYKKNVSLFNLSAGAFGSSLIFYLISNFGVWLTGAMYPLNFQGLVSCYAAAIPFFGNTLMSTFFYFFILFGGYYAVQKKNIILKPKNFSYSFDA